MRNSEAISSSDPSQVQSVLALLLRWKFWILAIILLTTLAMIAAAFLMKPVYRAKALLAPAASLNSSGAIESMFGQLGGVAALAGLGASADQRTKEALAVLGSRTFAEAFITDLKLMPVFYPEWWDAQKGIWREDADDAPSLAQAVQKFDRTVRRAYIDKKSGLVVIEVDWTDPQQSAAWVNEMVRRANVKMRERAIAEADLNITHLSAELARTDSVEIRSAINRLIEAQVKQRMLATVNPEYAFRVIDPAFPPDSRDPIRPNKVAYALAGPVLGVLLGLLFALGMQAIIAVRSVDSV